MIPRYTRPEMAAIWEPAQRFRIWFEIEAHACDAGADLGLIPKAQARAIRKRGRFDVAKIDAIEKKTRHDVISFLTNLAESVGPPARFIHRGMTSSDVLDTCLAVQLSRAAELIENLVIYPKAMRRNLDQLGGLVHSQQVLLALIDKGMSRERAYKIVQTIAMKIHGGGGSFKDWLAKDPIVRKQLSPRQLAALFDLSQHTRHVDLIFARVFGKDAR